MRVLAWIGATIVLLVVALVIAVLVVDWNRFREEAAELAGSALGRKVTIGTLDLDVGWTTHIRLTDVTVANPEWADDADFATVGEFRGAVRPWTLLFGPTEVPYLELTGGRFSLVRQANGSATWRFEPDESAEEGTTTDFLDSLPEIARLRIADSHLVYVDADAGIDVRGSVRLAHGETSGPQGVDLDLEGTLHGEPLRISVRGGAISNLSDADSAYPLAFDLRAGATRLSAEGSLTSPPDIDSFDVDANASGPGLHLLLPSLKLPLPNTPPYDLKARVTRDGEIWKATDLGGTIGESDIAGSLAVDVSGEKPLLTGDLATQQLHFDDLAPLVGLRKPGDAPGAPKKADTPKKATTGGGVPSNAERLDGIFPDVPLDNDRLKSANVDLRYRAKRIVSEILPFESIAGHVVLRDRKLLLQDLKAGVAGGRIAGDIGIDTRQSPNVTTASLSFERIGLKPFFEHSDFVEEMGGRFSGSVSLTGTGRTLADVMATADGSIAAGMTDGSVSGLLVEAAGLDLVESLALLIEDARVGIRCAKLDASLEGGVIRIQRMLMDTTDSALVAKGSVDLDSQVVDLVVSAFEKDFSLIDLASPVGIEGPLKGPSFSIAEIDPLPFFELGEQKDIDCAKLLEGMPSLGAQENGKQAAEPRKPVADGAEKPKEPARGDGQ